MVTIERVPAKRWHTAVAVDDNGRKLAERTVRATPAGHLELLDWAGRWTERRWALEDCRHLSRRLEADLLRAGEAVLRVPTEADGRCPSFRPGAGQDEPHRRPRPGPARVPVER